MTTVWQLLLNITFSYLQKQCTSHLDWRTKLGPLLCVLGTPSLALHQLQPTAVLSCQLSLLQGTNCLGGTAPPGNGLLKLVKHEDKLVKRYPRCIHNGCLIKYTVPQHPGYGQQIFLRGMCDPETKDVLFGHANQWQHTTPVYSHLHTRWDSCVLWNKKQSCTNIFHYHNQGQERKQFTASCPQPMFAFVHSPQMWWESYGIHFKSN
jgi:hypothetical protein